MMLDVAQSMALLIMAFLAVIILLGVLVIVHKQASRVKDLESRMKAIEKSEIDPTLIESPEEKEN